MNQVCVVILNYRRAELTIECLRSVEPEVAGRDDRCAVVIDNASGDGSADEIERAIATEGWDSWARVIRSPVNGGFAAGNNIGFRAVDAEAYLLLNSDARLAGHTIDGLLESARRHPEAGLIGPRLEGPDGEAQISCFRYRTPMSELLNAAGTGRMDRLFRRWIVAAGVFEEPTEAEWVSFACILIRRAVLTDVGLMDEDYFMYMEDIDYSRRAAAAGWRVLHDPTARAIHLRGGTSSVKAAMQARKRVPRYYYESRSRYFAKFYGGVAGVVMTNLCWLLGRSISLAREAFGERHRIVCEREFFDNWTNWRRPLQPPTLPEGGEL